MSKGIWQDFDGYENIAAQIAADRQFGADFLPDLTPDLINRLHPRRLKLRVSAIREETPTVKTIRLVAPDGWLPPFLAGQYITLYLTVGPVRTSRPYSLSSPPNQIGHWEITVRRVPGGMVSNHLLDRVTVDQEIETSGPAGQFYHQPLFHHRHQVCLAGGSGITPFMSMIREVADSDPDRTITLFHGSPTIEEAVFADRLTELARGSTRFTYHPVLEHPPAGWTGLTGYISGDLLTRTLGDLENKTFYLCGPQAMYDFCLAELARLDVPRRRIRREAYGPPANILAAPGWPAEVGPDDRFQIRAGGRTFPAPATRPLLETIEHNGLLHESLCRSGECGYCRMRIISGQVFQPAGTPVRRSDLRCGYVHSCVSYPVTDLELDI